MSFPRYPKYKPSGVEWIGDVPVGWEVVPFKHRCSRYALYGANMSSEEYVSDGVRFLRTTDISENGELEPDGVYVSPEVAREYLLKDKDILISRSGTIGRAFVFAADVHPECAYAGYLVRFVPTKQLNSRLFFYFTKSAAFSDWLQTQLIFSTIGNVNGQKYAQCRLTLPPLAEQTAIAEFLDRETGKIDGLVAEQRRLMELLKEKRQAVISHAVTKGLNPHAPMKPSGIEWLGDVPAGWEVRKLGSCTTITRLAGAEYTSFWQVDKEGAIIALRGQNIRENSLDIENCERISEELSQKLVRSKLFKGDVVYPCVGSIGNAALIEENDRFHINQNIAKITPHQDKVCPSFLVQFLNSKVALESALFLNTSDAQPSILVGNLRKVKMSLPPMDEQKEIADFLAERTCEFDTLTAEAQCAIDLLQERRTALISAAVTGQIDVRNQPRN